MTKNLNAQENCLKILEIGRNIISENKESECLTGTYVNTAVAKRVLFALLHQKSELNEAKEYCQQALKLKNSNRAVMNLLNLLR